MLELSTTRLSADVELVWTLRPACVPLICACVRACSRACVCVCTSVFARTHVGPPLSRYDIDPVTHAHLLSPDGNQVESS